jgi:hypothetical protein
MGLIGYELLVVAYWLPVDLIMWVVQKLTKRGTEEFMVK